MDNRDAAHGQLTQNAERFPLEVEFASFVLDIGSTLKQSMLTQIMLTSGRVVLISLFSNDGREGSLNTSRPGPFYDCND